MSVTSAAIVGAGVAGLTLALALARHGIDCDILEQADSLAEVGAGLQISPNAAHVLGALGLLPALEAVWHAPQRITLASGTSLRPLAAVACGAFARQRWGAPYGVLHRAALQQVLLDAVARNPRCRLHLGRRVAAASRTTIAAACTAPPGLIVGADGVRSAIRALVPGAPTATFSGNIAWRFVLPADVAPAFLDRDNLTAYLGPSSHLVCYPLRRPAGINVVAIVSGADPGMAWQADDRSGTVLAEAFRDWNPAIRTMLALASDKTFWPLHEAGPGRWHDGTDTVLIGDAAHAMMPFAAQGAAMAIEDAYELAGLVARLPLPQALAEFDARRQPRIARIRRRGAFNSFAYHARGPLRLGRDIVLSLRPPQALAADLDWIYGYRALG